MKRFIVIIFAMSMVGGIMAQERDDRFEVRLMAGEHSFTNYSRVSIDDNMSASYQAWNEGVDFGFHKGKNFYGIQYQIAISNLEDNSVTKENQAFLHRFALGIRHSELLGQHLEAYIGAAVGCAFMQNTGVSHIDQTMQSDSRFSPFGEAELGVNYVMPSGRYFGLRGAVLLPQSLSNTTSLHSYNLGGYNLSITYGIRF